MAVSNNNHFTINASYAPVPGTCDELPLIVLQYSNLENCRDQLCLIPSLGSSILILTKHLATPNSTFTQPKRNKLHPYSRRKKKKIKSKLQQKEPTLPFLKVLSPQIILLISSSPEVLPPLPLHAWTSKLAVADVRTGSLFQHSTEQPWLCFRFCSQEGRASTTQVKVVAGVRAC